MWNPISFLLEDLFLARRISGISAEVVQSVVHQRYKGRSSSIVTSNRVVQDWGKYLDGATMGPDHPGPPHASRSHARVRGKKTRGGRRPIGGQSEHD